MYIKQKQQQYDKIQKEVARKGNSTLGLAKCRKLLSSYPATCALIISAFRLGCNVYGGHVLALLYT
jgi:hypothetical protein